MRRDFTARNRRVSGNDRARHSGQNVILCVGVRHLIFTLDFDPDRVVITALMAAKCRCPRMPGALRKRHELDEFTVATNHQVR